MLAIGDIAFADEAHRTAVRRAVGGRWDESERDVVADALLAGLGARGITPAYRQVSFCAGVLTVRRAVGGAAAPTRA